MSKSKSLKKELRSWGILITIAGILYLTGLHTEVIGRVQQLVLATGIIKPSTEIENQQMEKASFSLPLTTLEGKPFAFSELKGKTIFINFWASWCPPCVAEMPNIQKLYQIVGNEEDIAFVMISVDEDLEKAKKFIDRKGFDFPVYFLNGPIPEVYQSQSIPTTFVINPEEKIIFKHSGMANYNNEEFKDLLVNS
ncbi:TlpA family protein disulfide reductase [Xanthovirga aplysinae]|uniref:TlpA family protein disulfide reductase n=1 Tax=Xanthovirga aplysinae TaxID=2529853 RepID=UPI0012BBAF1E|nr:TlpA disulfide reductase family protein [Xanthovirga aplysinae]MTI31040.1 TlpA family protein disulfide reductase [Xanthovirga aplysinae]